MSDLRKKYIVRKVYEFFRHKFVSSEKMYSMYVWQLSF